jgi:phosphoribosylformylglycinamidine synthase
VTDDGIVRIYWKGETVVAIPVDPIAENAPVHDRPTAARAASADPLDLTLLAPPSDAGKALLSLLGSSNLCSRHWVYRQYDQLVQSSTVLRPGGDAAVVRVPGTSRALALTTDCNPRFCMLDPYLGTQHAVAEAARNVAVTGARPLAVTNCLNFGNPERPESMWEFVEAVRGLGDACRALGTPVVSGNVSFYNETSGEGSIPPTPTIGMVGLLEDAERRVAAGFAGAGDVVLVLGETLEELGGSEYLAVIHGREGGELPRLDLEAEARLHVLLAEAAAEQLLRSAHDAAEGGLAVALAECALFLGHGVEACLEGDLRPDALLFGESASRAVVSVAPAHCERFEKLARSHQVPCARVGTSGGTRIRIEPGIDVALSDAHECWSRTLPEALG